ncbi:MAG: DPP IV N-terminal domain-containing protein [Armatimonadota bacterium]
MLPRAARHAALSLLALSALLAALPGWAQGTRADYERANNFRRLTQDKVARAAVRPSWLPDGSRFWYRVDLGDGKREFILIDAEKGTRAPAFDHARLAEALSRAAGTDYTADRLPFDRIALEENGVRFNVGEKGWKVDLTAFTAAEAEPLPAPPAPEDRRRGPGGRPAGPPPPPGARRVVLRDHNLYFRERDGEEWALTTDGKADDSYEQRVYWSPDGKKLVAIQAVPGDERKVTLVESSPSDQLQPKVRTLDYLKPGDKLAQRRPRLFDLESRKQIPVSEELIPNSWSIGELRWEPDSSRFTFLYNQRGHQVLRLISVDGSTGDARTLLEERSPTFIDYAHKQFKQYLPETDELVWMSERDGWCHLYLFDLRTGSLKNQITRGEWIVSEVERVDPEKRQIWFQAAGIDPQQDPYYVHHCRINFDGTGLVRLTEGDGTHTLQYSPDRRFYVDTYSRVDLPPVTELRRAEDGKLIRELERGDWSALLATGWQIPERFTAKGRDGKTDIYGVIFRPSNFDPSRQYPVLEDIYAGPQGYFVPKAFSAYHSPQGMAELGFIVVKIDGMGTSGRSKAFHDVCWKNLGDSGFPDRILWIQAAARKYPYLDLSRVGLYGGSAGGQSTLRGLLIYPEFYKAGVATCGCHDNRIDKIWWNELWMGWPVGPHYAEQSNVTQAHRLQGKLLLIVGEMDTNVDPASTLQVVNALVKADKDFDLLVVPGGGHGIGGPYGVRRQQDFFVRHLLGVEPRNERQ